MVCTCQTRAKYPRYRPIIRSTNEKSGIGGIIFHDGSILNLIRSAHPVRHHAAQHSAAQHSVSPNFVAQQGSSVREAQYRRATVRQVLCSASKSYLNITSCFRTMTKTSNCKYKRMLAKQQRILAGSFQSQQVSVNRLRNIARSYHRWAALTRNTARQTHPAMVSFLCEKVVVMPIIVILQ